MGIRAGCFSSGARDARSQESQLCGREKEEAENSTSNRRKGDKKKSDQVIRRNQVNEGSLKAVRVKLKKRRGKGRRDGEEMKVW